VPRKILVIRFSSIGDIVLCTPVFRCLKKQLGAEVQVLTKPAFATLLEANPYVDHIHTLQDDWATTIRGLRLEEFDHIVDLHKNLRSWRVKRALRVPSTGFYKLNFEKWLLVRFKINLLPAEHIVDRYLRAVATLGIHDDGKGLDYFIPSTQHLTSQELAQRFFADRPDLQKLVAAGKFLVIAIGAAHQTKRLPTQHLRSLCASLRHPVLLLGGPSEKEEGVEIARGMAHVASACGELNLHGSAAAIAAAETIITHDTGMMHIAAALGKPIRSVWGNTIPAFGMYPYYPQGQDRNQSFEVRVLPCRPCSKIGHQQCPKGHFRCMLDQDLPAIVRSCGPPMLD